MNRKPAASPIAKAVPATANTSPAPECLRGGSDSTFASSSAITALFGRELLGELLGELFGELLGELFGLSPREAGASAASLGAATVAAC